MSKSSFGEGNKKNTASSVSLATWGKDIHREYIDPIEEMIEIYIKDELQEDGISDISDSSHDSLCSDDSNTIEYFLKMRRLCWKRLSEILKRPCFRVSSKKKIENSR